MFMMKLSPLYESIGLFTMGCVINGSIFRVILRDNEMNNRRLTEKRNDSPL